ncbi:hypothetical protein BT69DRAFT_1365804 [Atractiella rhizophila]|nr:hypothetical protein BT69DRAFT_1365804 [Atractiella rhizophila]
MAERDETELVHYRIVWDKVGRPLSKSRTSYELVKGFLDGFEVHSSLCSIKKPQNAAP